MASRSHKSRPRRRGRKNPVLDLRTRLDRNDSLGDERGGEMHNLQMTVQTDGDFGRRFKHVPELEEEEAARPRMQQRSNSEVSDLREKLHTSHGNHSMVNDGSRRIRRHHRGGLEIQVETSIEEYQLPSSSHFEEYGEYRRRRDDLQSPIDYQNYHQEYFDEGQPRWRTDDDDIVNYNHDNQHYQPYSPERHHRRHAEADFQYMEEGHLRNPRDEEYREHRDSNFDFSARLNRGNGNFYYDNEDEFYRGTNLDTYDERQDFNNPESNSLDQRNYSPYAARSRSPVVRFTNNGQIDFDNIEPPQESVSDLIPQINILPVASRQRQILEGLPLPAPTRKESLPSAKKTLSEQPSTSSSRRRPRSLTKQTSKDPIALIGEDPFASEAVNDGLDKKSTSSFKDFMINKNSKSLAEIRNHHIDEVKKSRSSNPAHKELSKRANRSLSPRIRTSKRRSVDHSTSRYFDPKRAKSHERKGGGLPLPAPTRKESLLSTKETLSEQPSTSSSRRRPRSLTKQTSKDPIALISEDPFATEVVNDGLDKKSTSSFKDFMINKNSKSLAEIRNYHNDEINNSRTSNPAHKKLSKRANRSLSPRFPKSERRSVDHSTLRDFDPKRPKSDERKGGDSTYRNRRGQKSPRAKSRSPQRRPPQHRSPKDTRGRIKSSKGRSNRERSMSPSCPSSSRKSSKKSPVSSLVRDDPIEHRTPPPPPRDLFASFAADEKVVVKEEIVDLACSDEEDEGKNSRSFNTARKDYSASRCDQRGQIAMVCNSAEKIQKPRFEQGQVLTCYNCDLKGHLMRNCPFKKTKESLKKKQACNNDHSAPQPVISIDYHHLETKSAAPITKPLSTLYTFIQEAKNNTEIAKAMMFTWNLAGHDQDTLYELMQKKSPQTRIQLRKILIDELLNAPAGQIPMSVAISELLDLTQDYLMPQDRVNLIDGKINGFGASSKSSFTSSSKLPSEKKASLDTSEAMGKLYKLLAMIDLQVGPPNSEDRQRFDLRLDELEPLRGFIVERMSRKASQFSVAEEYVHKTALAIVKVLSVCNFELKLMERHLQNYGEDSFAELLECKLRIYSPHLPSGITSAYVSNFVVDFFDSRE